MGIQDGAAALPLSPLGEACLRMDLTAIHEILEKLGYKDDEGTATEVCFWYSKMEQWNAINAIIWAFIISFFN